MFQFILDGVLGRAMPPMDGLVKCYLFQILKKSLGHHRCLFNNSSIDPEVIQNFMLNSAEQEIFPAHKC